MERKEAYARIKELNLQEECKKQYGKNFTQCKTDELVHLVQSFIIKEKQFNKNKVKAVTKVATKVKPVEATTEFAATTEEPKDCFYKLLAILRKRHILLESDIKNILE